MSAKNLKRPVRRWYDRVSSPFECVGASQTKQAFKEECDINRIMRKFERTGMIEHARTVPGGYGDFCSAPEFHEACNVVLAAQEMFSTVPSKVRKRFDNDPAAFLAFVQDPANADEMVELGLARPSPAASPASASAEIAEGDADALAPSGAPKESSA